MNRRNNLNRLAHFAAIIEEGSITAAADRLGISKAVVSKQLILLERELGVSLVVRNSRHLLPTDAGLLFYEKCKGALEQANEAFDVVASGRLTVQGTIRLTAPVDYGIMHLAPLVAEFARTYPDVRVDLKLSDERLDPVAQSYDLAVRVGWLEDSENVARKLADFTEVVVCSRSLVSDGEPGHPRELANLPFIANTALARPCNWTFQKGEETCNVELQPSVSMNVGPGIREVVTAAGGFAIAPEFIVEKDLAEGRLLRLLPDWSLRTGGIYLVFPPIKYRPYAVQTFADMLVRSYRKPAQP